VSDFRSIIDQLSETQIRIGYCRAELQGIFVRFAPLGPGVYHKRARRMPLLVEQQEWEVEFSAPVVTQDGEAFLEDQFYISRNTHELNRWVESFDIVWAPDDIGHAVNEIFFLRPGDLGMNGRKFDPVAFASPVYGRFRWARDLLRLLESSPFEGKVVREFLRNECMPEAVEFFENPSNSKAVNTLVWIVEAHGYQLAIVPARGGIVSDIDRPWAEFEGRTGPLQKEKIEQKMLSEMDSMNGWFKRVRATLADNIMANKLVPIKSLAQFRLLGPEIDTLSPQTLHFGYRLGLVDARSIVELMADREQRGLLLSKTELCLAPLREDELDKVPLLLNNPEADLQGNSAANAFWLWWILCAMVGSWKSGQGDPCRDLKELGIVWGEPVHELWTCYQPRGIDALYYGVAARRRFVKRIARWSEVEKRSREINSA